MIGCSITVLVLDVIAMPRSGARCLRQNQVNINIIYYQYYSFTVERQAAKNITDYRKIPEISPSKYKSPKPVTQSPSVKSPLQI